MSSDKYAFVFSLGYRCSSAGILKSLQLKKESYPFDWMVSRIPIIEHCIDNQFDAFLDKSKYESRHSATYGYPTDDPSSRQWICDESIRINTFYEHEFVQPNIHLYMANYLTTEHDAYSHKLMMNHHNITNDKDYYYYERCICRWNKMWNSPDRKLSLYIHPVIFYKDYNPIKKDLQDEIRRFHRSIVKKYPISKHSHDGIYIIPVKTPYDDPTKHCARYILEEQPDDEWTPNCRICVLWANKDFIDAGEIFMGNSGVETYVIKDYVLKTAENGCLL